MPETNDPHTDTSRKQERSGQQSVPRMTYRNARFIPGPRDIKLLVFPNIWLKIEESMNGRRNIQLRPTP
jgi:hypothetical protein